MLTVAQTGHRHGIGRVAGEVVAAEALDRHDPPGAEIRQRGGQRRFPVRRRGSVAGTPVRELRPQSGHATGSAWKRRFRRVAVLGSHAATVGTRHRRSGRGRREARRWIVARGPQLVQLVNG